MFDQCRCDHGRKGSRVRLETINDHHAEQSLPGGIGGDHSAFRPFNSTTADSRYGNGQDQQTTFRDNYRWGGCSDSVDFGFELAKSFLDEREVGHDSKAIINLHNNLVGRLVSYSRHETIFFANFHFKGGKEYNAKDMQVSRSVRQLYYSNMLDEGEWVI